MSTDTPTTDTPTTGPRSRAFTPTNAPDASSAAMRYSAVSDDDKRRSLKRMKLVALSLLLGAAAIYLITLAFDDAGFVGYVRAFAEAAMVGALADWFAVTALFRHPLGLPIPHTAIIPERKDQIGRSLGDFVESNFLTKEVVSERLRNANIGVRLGDWLADSDHAQRAAGALGDVVRGALEVLDDNQVQAGLERMIRDRVDQVPLAPLTGRVIDITVEGDHHQRLLDAVLVGVRGFMADNRLTFRQRLDQESPWWVPDVIDDKVFEKIYDAVERFTADVEANPNHEVRRSIDQRVRALGERMKTDPEMHRRAEELKAELVDHPEVRSWIESLWQGIKSGVIVAAADPSSELRVQIADAIQQFGDRLRVDPELQASVDSWVDGAVGYLVENYRSEVSDLIATTVERWDGHDAANRMELQVGRDLQFIRINGTIVGGCAGLAIHAITQLF